MERRRPHRHCISSLFHRLRPPNGATAPLVPPRQGWRAVAVRFARHSCPCKRNGAFAPKAWAPDGAAALPLFYEGCCRTTARLSPSAPSSPSSSSPRSTCSSQRSIKNRLSSIFNTTSSLPRCSFKDPSMVFSGSPTLRVARVLQVPCGAQ